MAEHAAETDDDFPDERLKLLFVCAHPAIDEAARTPLMLQTVLGLDAQVIAFAFLVAPSAMAQRLVRAEAKIKAAAIPFTIPEATAWPERITFVLDAVYAAFNRGWQSGPDDAPGREVATEALRLGDVLEKLVPDEPEVLGLQSLMLHCQARRTARGDANGQYIPLDDQDCALWDHQMIDHAESLLHRAGRLGKPGRFQIEAAIQSAHAQRRVTAGTEWRVITALYELLMTLSPALGARIGHAIAVGRAVGPEQGLKCLDDLPQERLHDHQPYWAARARLLADAGHHEAARAAYSKAIGLSDDPAIREYLLRQSRREEASVILIDPERTEEDAS